jgi:hypothetical protein
MWLEVVDPQKRANLGADPISLEQEDAADWRVCVQVLSASPPPRTWKGRRVLEEEDLLNMDPMFPPEPM